MFTDQSGKTFRIFGSYRPDPVGPVQVPERPGRLRRQAERRRARVRGRIHGADERRRHRRGDHRLQLPQQLRAVGHVARRRLPERQRRPAGLPRELGDGVRQLRLLVERRPADVAGGPPARPVRSGRGVAPGRSGHHAGGRRLRRRVADRQCLLRERRLGPSWDGTFFAADAGRNEVFAYQAGAPGRRLRARSEGLPDLERQAAICRVGLRRRQRHRQGRDRDAVPAVGHRGRSRRRAVCQRLDRRARRRTPGSGRHAVGGDLPDRAEGVRLESPGVRSRDDRRPDHGAAIAGGERAGDRLRRTEGAWRGGRERRGRAAQRSQPLHARPGDLPALPAWSRRPSARGRARVVYRSGAAHRRLPGDAARGPRHPAGGRAARRATPTPASGARWRCRCATSRPTSRWTSSSTSRAASTGRIAATWKRSAPAPPARSRRSTSGCTASSASTTIRSPGRPTFTWLAWRLHVPAAVPDLSARARSSKLSLADRRFAMDTLAFINDPAASKAMLSLAQPDSPLREPATLWLLNRMSNDWAESRPAAGAQGGRDLRSRHDRRCTRRSCRRRRRICPSSRSTGRRPPHRRRRAREEQRPRAA